VKLRGKAKASGGMSTCDTAGAVELDDSRIDI
jgi:hypothetical protein